MRAYPAQSATYYIRSRNTTSHRGKRNTQALPNALGPSAEWEKQKHVAPVWRPNFSDCCGDNNRTKTDRQTNENNPFLLTMNRNGRWEWLNIGLNQFNAAGVSHDLREEPSDALSTWARDTFALLDWLG